MWVHYSMSTGITIPSYSRTNMGAGSSTEDVIYSDSASGVVGNTATFSPYTTTNLEFSFQATLSPGKPV